MLARTIVLMSLILLGFSSPVAFAVDNGPDWIGGDLRKACDASNTVCVQACQGNNACTGKCDLAYLECLNSVDDAEGPGPELSRRPDAEIRTGAGLCLDVHAPEMGTNGGRVQAWTCNGAPQQRWTYDRTSSAVRVASGLCLDVHAGILQNGNRVQVWSCNGQAQQQWTPLKNGSLRNSSGFCLDVHAADQTRNGARVQVWQCNGSQQQRFTSGAF